MRLSKVFIIASLITSIALSGWTFKTSCDKQPSVTNSFQSEIETGILFYVNDYRNKKGLAALEMNTDISLQAEKHSAEMASNKVAFGHDGFEDRVKIITKKIGNIHSSAENVAYGNLSPKQVVDVWLKSAGHRKNIEGKYTLTGIGTAVGKDNVIYFTQIFTSK